MPCDWGALLPLWRSVKRLAGPCKVGYSICIGKSINLKAKIDNTILLVLKFQTAAVTPATTTHQNAYEKVVYNAATSFLTQQAQSTKPTWQKSEKPTFKLSGQGGKSWNNRNTGPPKVQQLHYCEVCKISCAGPQVRHIKSGCIVEKSIILHILYRYDWRICGTRKFTSKIMPATKVKQDLLRYIKWVVGSGGRVRNRFLGNYPGI